MQITFKTRSVKEKFVALEKEWCDCKACPLSENRRKVVHFRGQMPCDILMIGEAPGVSEDVMGFPFVGEAGHLLNQGIEEEIKYRWGICNVVACIPLNDDNQIRQPKGKEMQACRARLVDLIAMCQPKAVIILGRTAENANLAISGLVKQKRIPRVEVFEAPHPAFVLRCEKKQQPVEFKRIIHALRKANDVCDGKVRTEMV